MFLFVSKCTNHADIAHEIDLHFVRAILSSHETWHLKEDTLPSQIQSTAKNIGEASLLFVRSAGCVVLDESEDLLCPQCADFFGLFSGKERIRKLSGYIVSLFGIS